MIHPLAAWHPDPLGRHELRYWSGQEWTEHVSDTGAVSVDQMVSAPHQSSRPFELDLPRCSYLGTHPSFDRHIALVGLRFGPDHAAMFDPSNGNEGSPIPYADMLQIRVEPHITTEERVSALRVLLLGVVGLFLKKTVNTAFLTIAQADGDWRFGVDGATPTRLNDVLQPLRALHPELFSSPALVADPSARSVADRLAVLDALWASGTITDAERTDRRAAILDEV